MIKIKVPATTANIGPGFDCLGMALNLYNIIEVHKDVDRLTIETNLQNSGIHTDESNLIYIAMKRLFEEAKYEIPPVRIVENINIPLSRGFGSSAACIVAGLVGANEMLGKHFSKEKLLEIAAEIEGHPDNVSPALLGGFVVSTKTKDGVKYVKSNVNKDIMLLAVIPDFEMSTKDARNILPSVLNYGDAVSNIGFSSLLTASLITGNMDNIKYTIEDRIHEPYRLKLIPHSEDIKKKAYEFGADAFFLSGSGSTLMSLISNESIYDNMKHYLSSVGLKWDIKILNPDNIGVVVENI